MFISTIGSCLTGGGGKGNAEAPAYFMQSFQHGPPVVFVVVIVLPRETFAPLPSPHTPRDAFSRSLWHQATPPFEDTSNWQLDPSFDGFRIGGGGGAGGQGGGSKNRNGKNGGDAAEADPDRVWPSATP